MNNAIEEIKRQYAPIVQPVRLFETRNNKQNTPKELSEFINTIKNRTICSFGYFVLFIFFQYTPNS